MKTYILNITNVIKTCAKYLMWIKSMVNHVTTITGSFI